MDPASTKPTDTQPVVTPAIDPAAQTVDPAALPAADLSKYKMSFHGLSFNQLMELVKSSTLLDPEDHPKFIEKYQNEQDAAEIDKAFNVLFEEEMEYLTEQAVEIDKMLAGQLKDDPETMQLKQSFADRINILTQVATALSQGAPAA